MRRPRILWADSGHKGEEIDPDARKAVTTKDVFIEQVINSVIVAGIAAVATWTGIQPDYLVMGKAFLTAFLIESRKYRRIK